MDQGQFSEVKGRVLQEYFWSENGKMKSIWEGGSENCSLGIYYITIISPLHPGLLLSRFKYLKYHSGWYNGCFAIVAQQKTVLNILRKIWKIALPLQLHLLTRSFHVVW